VTEAELHAFSGEHLFYELEMTFWTAPLVVQYAMPKNVDEQVIKNALLESFLVHVRVLKAFLYDPRSYADDVLAEDYVTNPEEWQKRRGPVPDALKRASRRTGGEVAHLTTRRESEPTARQWNPRELLDALIPAVCQFVAMTPPARLDWRIHQLAVDLGCKTQKNRGAHLQEVLRDASKRSSTPDTGSGNLWSRHPTAQQEGSGGGCAWRRSSAPRAGS
jgi:hypothetical protein